jgi:protein subunit release factor A
MIDKLQGIEARYEELNRLMAESAEDYGKVAEYAKERSSLEDLVVAFREYQGVLKDADEARGWLASEEMRELAEAELFPYERHHPNEKEHFHLRKDNSQSVDLL